MTIHCILMPEILQITQQEKGISFLFLILIAPAIFGHALSSLRRWQFAIDCSHFLYSSPCITPSKQQLSSNDMPNCVPVYSTHKHVNLVHHGCTFQNVVLALSLLLLTIAGAEMNSDPRHNAICHEIFNAGGATQRTLISQKDLVVDYGFGHHRAVD